MRRRRVTLVIALVLLVVVVLSLRSIATFYTDYLWFKELGQASVFWRTLTAKLILGVIFGSMFFLLLWANLFIADRLAPVFVPDGPEEQAIVRYRDAIAPYRRWIRIGLSAVIGLFVGFAVVPRWSDWLLFLNRTDFGVNDPHFGNDVGFYVFQLPFYEFLVNWFLASLIFITLATAAVHYVNGGIRFQTTRRERVLPAVKAHLSVLFGILALFKGGAYFLDRFRLLYSERGFEFSRGASATDVSAQLPALTLLAGIMILVAVLFLLNIRLRGWLLPTGALAIWVLVSVVAGGVFPLVYQRLRVTPQEASAERPYIDRNIRYTRLAFNLDPEPGVSGITITQYSGAPTLTPEQISDNAVTIQNVRVWDPRVLPDTYKQLEALRNFYEFNDVDVDRYYIDVTNTATGAVKATPQQVLLSVRELNSAALPSQSWVNRHLQFTHGYGVVISEANNVEPRSGQPIFLLQDIPVQTTGTPAQNEALALSEPRVYFGEGLEDYAIVGTQQREFDYPTQEGLPDVETIYDGGAGVRLSNVFMRAAFALRFGNVNPLISGQMTSESRVIFRRDIVERIHAVAPFLALDADPYPAIVDKRVVWIQDAYTVSDAYPYAQVADTTRVRAKAHSLRTFPGINYIRNSVKVTVDAYDGTVTLWVVDPSDPIVRSYAKIFPTLFTFDDPGDELRSHFRYPEDLFRVQSDLYRQYHTTDPDAFFRQQDVWEIPNNPSKDLPVRAGEETRKQEPYYLLMRLPDDESRRERFVIIQPFTPSLRQNMVSFLVAQSDPDGYGEIIDYRLPSGSAVEGPNQVFARINQQTEISRDISLLNQQGSKLIQGNLLVIPIDESVLYVQPFYVQSAREGTSLPQFNRVVVVYGDRVVQAPNLDAALTDIFGVSPASPTSPGTGTQDPGTTPTVPPDVTPDDDVASLLAQAAEEFRLADEALMRGDLAEYQRHIERAQQLIEQAIALSGPPPDGDLTPTVPPAPGLAPPSPSPIPSPSPSG